MSLFDIALYIFFQVCKKDEGIPLCLNYLYEYKENMVVV